MFRAAYFDPFDLYDDLLGGGRSYYGFDGDINRNSFAPVSKRALEAEEVARNIFLRHLATVDTTNGPVTTEIIEFHLVPDMRKRFSKFVREHGCSATSRKLTRQEQDAFNKNRKSLMYYTSVKVTPDAQKAYLAKNPAKAQQPQAPVATGGPSTSKIAATAEPKATPLATSQKLKRGANAAQLDGPATNKKAKSS